MKRGYPWIPQIIRISEGSPKWSRYVQIRLSESTIYFHWTTQLSATLICSILIYVHIQLSYTIIYHNILSHIIMYIYVYIYIIKYHILSWIIICYHISSYIIIYHHILSCKCYHCCHYHCDTRSST